MILLSTLRRFERQLRRMAAEFEAHNPGLAANMGEWSNGMTETIRNAATAEAEISTWINYRKQNRCDPPLPAWSDDKT